MATEACRDWRGDLAIEALGRLEEPAHTALVAHLDGCADCRAALAELTAVAGALDFADVNRVADGDLPGPSGELGDRILGRLQWERSVHRRRRNWGFVAAATGVAAALILVLLLVGGTRQNQQHGTVVALRSPQHGVSAQATLFQEHTGTRVKLHVDGLDDHEWYWLWVTGSNGQRIAAGSFSASSADENLTMSAALSRAATKRVWVTDGKNNVVLDGYVGTT